MIDAHAHLAPGKAGDLLSMMDALGIERAVVVAGRTVDPSVLAEQIENGGGTNVDVDNATVFEQCESTGFRLLPFYFANPHKGDEDYARDGNVFDGLKLGPAVHGVPFADARMQALIARAERFGHAVYLHCLAHQGFKVIDFTTHFAARFPGVRFILGHAGVGNCDFVSIDHIAPYDNVWFEMSGGFSSVCRAAVQRLGSKRVLFGTEYPLQDPRVEIAKLATLDLANEQLVHIVRNNIIQLLQRNNSSSSCAA